jgi:hypothetical protein
MTGMDVYESEIQRNAIKNLHRTSREKQEEPLTQPSVINPLSSVNRMTSSSSSIVQVSLVECCFGINNVETTYLLPLSLPSSNPHVSMFRSVFALAIVKKRGRHPRGRLIVRKAGAASVLRVLDARVIRSGIGANMGPKPGIVGGAGRAEKDRYAWDGWEGG